MMAHSSDTHSPEDGTHLHTISLISSLFQEEFRNGSTSLGEILHDVIALYQGSWPDYEACAVGYHTLQHSTDVALLAARIIVGWNRAEPSTFSQDHFLVAITAALFHDSGYIKDRGDTVGLGGKYTFCHIPRSKHIMASYLADRAWAAHDVEQATALLDVTDLYHTLDLDEAYPEPTTRRLAAILGTADLIAQMANINYMANIRLLFQEIEEAYAMVGREQLERQGHRLFESVEAMQSEAMPFYEHLVLPRLRHLGSVYHYLGNVFDDGRNPYLENILANLSHQLLGNDSQWQQIGSILTSLGAISQEQLSDALRRQQAAGHQQRKPQFASFQRRFLQWSNGQTTQQTLGDILIDMKAISPATLCQGLIAQILPPTHLASLKHDHLTLLLTVSVMLHGACRDPWVFQQILSLTAKQLGCAGGSILLAVPERQEMIVAVSTLLAREHFEGKTIPADKGLAGWVYSHGQPTIVNAIDQDARVEKSLDRRTPCPPESILAAPMCNNSGRFGVLEMFNKQGGFTESDSALLVMVANIIAVALGAILVSPS